MRQTWRPWDELAREARAAAEARGHTMGTFARRVSHEFGPEHGPLRELVRTVATATCQNAACCAWAQVDDHAPANGIHVSGSAVAQQCPVREAPA